MSAKKLTQKLTQEERILKSLSQNGGTGKTTTLAKELGISEKSCAHTMNLLARGNFIKKTDDGAQLTPHGVEFCKNIA